MTGLETLIVIAVVSVGSTLQGAVGFGLGLIAAPVLALVEPQLVPGPLLSNAMVLTVLLSVREWRFVDKPGVAVALLGRLPGTILGAAALAMVSSRVISIGFGLVILGGVIMSAVGPRFERSRAALFGAGVISGFMGTTTSVGGPPIALVYQYDEGSRIRGTLAAYFSVGVTMSLIALASIGRFGRAEIAYALLLTPGIAIGFTVSRYLAGRLHEKVVRPAVLAVSAIASLAVIVRAVW